MSTSGAQALRGGAAGNRFASHLTLHVPAISLLGSTLMPVSFYFYFWSKQYIVQGYFHYQCDQQTKNKTKY